MKDFIKKYHKKQVKTNALIIVGALITAIGVNFFLMDGTDIGKNLTTSVLNSVETEKKSDIYLQADENKIHLKNNTEMKSVEDFSISIATNPEVIKIISANSPLGEVSILGDEEEGMQTFLLEVGKKDIAKNTRLITLETEKQKQEITHINLINGNFTDASGDKYETTTSGITY